MGLPAAVLKPDAYAAGFRGEALTTIVAIGQAEGGGYHCNPDCCPQCVSCGPWQIFFGASGTCEQTRGLGGGKMITRTFAATGIGSAMAAWEISGHGTSFEPWSTYKNKAYLQYMPGGKGYTPPAKGSKCKWYCRDPVCGCREVTKPDGTTCCDCNLAAGTIPVCAGCGTCPSAAGSALSTLGDLVGFVTSGSNWARLGMALGGAVLMVLGLYVITSDVWRTQAPPALKAKVSQAASAAKLAAVA